MLPINSALTDLPDAVFSFFQNVDPEGYPEKQAIPQRCQPWRKVWQGPTISPDGSNVIALPKRVDFGNYFLCF